MKVPGPGADPGPYAGPPSRAVPRVVTMGEVMALLLAEDAQPLGSGSRFEFGFAGAEATVAVGLARLGHRSAYVGRVGADPLGQQLLRSIRGYGVDVTAVREVADRPTGLLVRDAPAGRPISVQYYRHSSAGSTLAPSDVPADLIRESSLLHVTGITAALSESAREALEHAIAVAREAGTTVSFDPNVRHKLASADQWRQIIERLAPLADIVLTGSDDARVVTDGDPAAWFLDRGAATVVVKHGARGACETDGRGVVRQDVVPTTVVDPVGAGDAFAAGWIGAWLRGRPPAERLREAATVASLCVATRGDVPGLPDAATLERCLRQDNDVDR